MRSAIGRLTLFVGVAACCAGALAQSAREIVFADGALPVRVQAVTSEFVQGDANQRAKGS